MTENAEDRTKRIFCELLKDHDWKYQYTVFFRTPGDFADAHEYADQIRKRLRRAYSHHALLWRLTLKRQPKRFFEELAGQDGWLTAPNLVLFSQTELVDPCFDTVVTRAVRTSLRTSRRRFSTERRLRYANTVARERPHNLRAVFWKPKVKRFGVLNSKQIGARD